MLLCDQRGCDLEDLTLDDFKAESDLFESDIVECLNLPAIVAARTTFGGTAPEAVRVQLAAAQGAAVRCLRMARFQRAEARPVP